MITRYNFVDPAVKLPGWVSKNIQKQYLGEGYTKVRFPPDRDMKMMCFLLRDVCRESAASPRIGMENEQQMEDDYRRPDRRSLIISEPSRLLDIYSFNKNSKALFD